MNELVYGVWEGKVIDPANGGATLLSQIEKLGEYEPGNPIRALMGWDGFLLFAEPRGQGGGEGVDLVDMARAYMAMTQGEACGKCVPGRMGTKVAADILARIADGRGEEGDIRTLRNVGELVRAGSMCELCHTSMTGVLAMIDRYEEIFRQAIADGGAGSARRPRRRYHTKVTAPCIEACPERLDIPRYIENIKAGRYTESLSVIHEKNPLASVCGRVCVRFCEFACRRGKLDDPINIKHLKRFVSDVEQDAAVKKVAPVVVTAPDAKRVAVIGAGPAGVTAAYHLLRRGYAVEIFEALDEPGGMAAVGIPDYRLPRDVLRSEVEVIRQMGAAIHYERRLGRDFTLQSLRAAGFEAIFVAIGAQGTSSLRVPGEELKPAGYYPGIDFLRRVNRAEPIEAGKVAVVVGGGNVAMDCARSSLRLGVEQVHLVYRRDRAEMPADKVEVQDAEEEGVIYHFLSNPTRLVIEEGRLVGVECIRMALGEPDASGRRSPAPVPGSEFVIPCDMVIPAIGQKVDTSCLDKEGAPGVSKWGTLAADAGTLVTDQPGIFAGGDCVSGPATLIEAMAAGFRVSRSIDQYFREGRVSLSEDERMSRVYRALSTVEEEDPDRLGGAHRIDLPMRAVPERIQDFDEVESGLSPEDALLEADRCLRCYRIFLVATER